MHRSPPSRRSRGAALGRQWSRPAICLPPLLSRVRGSDAGAVGHRRARIERLGPDAHLHAGVPAERRDERHARRDLERSDGIARPPPARAHAQHVVCRGRQRVRADRGQVLVGERIADQRIAGAVLAPRERAEGRRDASGLNVDRPIAPRTDAHVQGVRFDASPFSLRISVRIDTRSVSRTSALRRPGRGAVRCARSRCS